MSDNPGAEGGKTVKIGVLGRGTVGSALIGLLEERAAVIEAETGLHPVVSGVLTRSQGDGEQIVDEADVIVEVMGGLEPAEALVRRALMAGKPVVTANKQLLSRKGDQLFPLASEHGAALRYEAAVGGAVPIVRVLGDTLSATPVERVHGIVNGTTNYILTAMAKRGESYAEALKDAQDAGFAEADPTEDVSGSDAAAKMALLAMLAFGTWVSIDDVDHTGIDKLDLQDIAYAREFDLALKLVGTAEKLADGSVSVRVHPMFLPMTHPLASVDGSYNAVTIESPHVEEITLQGPGAGGLPTASAVLGDLISVLHGADEPKHAWVTLPKAADVDSAFYLHFEVDDEPGVLSQVAQVLGLQKISIRSVAQKGSGDGARLVMITHRAPESAMAAAIGMISGLGFVRGEPRAIRVFDEENA
ncbi:MAG: homoserine dehydrogenase [Solirubrobacteraceae bacterium]|nr:homoserine dehydrogenase [Solirubrobacteraceae bacterium]